jgi:hypothetical protein
VKYKLAASALGKIIIGIVLIILNGCTTIKCYQTPFDYNACMESAYATIINATGTNTKPELYMTSVISIFLNAKRKRKNGMISVLMRYLCNPR